MKRIEVTLAQDHVEGLTKLRKPLIAIEELIWNGLDADATEITVEIQENTLGGLDLVTVTDNGTGIAFGNAEAAFGSLGNSPKLGVHPTPAGRALHGKSGKGRFRAFGIGREATWLSRYKRNGGVKEFTIKGRKESLRYFEISAEKDAPGASPGVAATIKGCDRGSSALSNKNESAQELARRLALYLKKYPGIRITYAGCLVDPRELESYSETILLDLKDESGAEVPSELTVIEWKTAADRALYLCDETGFAYEERSPGIQAPGFNFTAYLKSPLIRNLAEVDAFALKVLHPVVGSVIESTKQVLRRYFREREATRALDLVKKWKDERVYPYDHATSDAISQVERQVFDVCAVKVNEYLPNFEKSDPKNKRLTFRLIREALESNPSSLQKILRQVLELPEEQQNELAEILERTKLSAIINAARTVIDRLTFLGSLDHLLFGSMKERLLERSQLHRILVNELWLFGEQYALGVDDGSLTALLRKHIEILEREDLNPIDGGVHDLGGKDRFVDLMLHRRYPQGQEGKFEHLVVELKRPNCKLGKKEVSQIEDYAFSVASDERFDKTNTKWTFILVGNDFLPFAEQRAKEQSREYGHIYASADGMNIHLKKWSALIDQAKWRYNFFREKLELQVASADGVELLRRKYSQFLPDPDPGSGP